MIEKLETSAVLEFSNQHIPNDITEYLGENYRRETKKGTLTYDLLCAAMQDDSGNIIVIRKELYLPSDDTDDWLVMSYKPGSTPKEEHVLAVKSTSTDDGDTIMLEIAPDVDYHGNYIVRFGVNSNYGPNGAAITKSHISYYGRGSGREPNLTLDSLYYRQLPFAGESTPEYTADIIYLDNYRERNVGQTAVIN